MLIEFKLDEKFNSRFRDTTKHFPFITIFENNIWSDELGSWLINTVGENHINWEWWWNMHQNKYLFEFKYEEDKVKFILRWL